MHYFVPAHITFFNYLIEIKFSFEYLDKFMSFVWIDPIHYALLRFKFSCVFFGMVLLMIEVALFKGNGARNMTPAFPVS